MIATAQSPIFYSSVFSCFTWTMVESYRPFNCITVTGLEWTLSKTRTESLNFRTYFLLKSIWSVTIRRTFSLPLSSANREFQLLKEKKRVPDLSFPSFYSIITCNYSFCDYKVAISLSLEIILRLCSSVISALMRRMSL